jgi:tetratricopeptide (TPR) repeat protein
VVLGLAGCVQALREPPPLESLGKPETRPAQAQEVDSLLKRAEILYASRTPESVREAEGLWLTAARADPGRIEGLVGAARAAVWLSDHLTAPEAREESATRGVQAAQWCGRIAPASAECDYWLGATLGVQARERRSTALDALPRIEEAFKRAAERNPLLDEAGPHRALALLYLRAPGWPTGPGDPDRGLEEARQAVSLRPEYPPNQLALAEALVTAGNSGEAARAFSRALELARNGTASGDPEAAEWIQEAERGLSESGRGK